MVWQTFKYPTWLTFKIHQGCHQLHIWGSIDLLPVKYLEVILGTYHPIQHKCLPYKSKTSAIPSDWVWRNSINYQFGPKTNPYQQSNNFPDYIIPLEGNPINKLKEPHFQVKCLSKYSMLHWNHIHICPYIHPCFQVISLTVINILHRIGWFTRRNQNWVIVTTSGACPQTPYPTTLPLNRDPGPYRHH